jgi:DNA-directed RNA polymerase omega subunit
MYKLPENMKSKYEFVTLAAKRAEQLQMGAAPRVDDEGGRKATVLAQAEVAQGLVAIWEPAEQAVVAEGEEE